MSAGPGNADSDFDIPSGFTDLFSLGASALIILGCIAVLGYIYFDWRASRSRSRRNSVT